MGRINNRFDQPSAWQQNAQSSRRRRVILLALLIVVIFYCTTSWFQLDNKVHLQSIAKYHPHDASSDSVTEPLKSTTDQNKDTDDAAVKGDDEDITSSPGSSSSHSKAEELPIKQVIQEKPEGSKETTKAESNVPMTIQHVERPLAVRPSFLEPDPEEAADQEPDDDSDE